MSKEVFCILRNYFEDYDKCYNNCPKFDKNKDKCSIIKDIDFIPKEKRCRFQIICPKYIEYDSQPHRDFTILPDFGRICEKECWKCNKWHTYNFQEVITQIIEELDIISSNMSSLKLKENKRAIFNLKKQLAEKIGK